MEGLAYETDRSLGSGTSEEVDAVDRAGGSRIYFDPPRINALSYERSAQQGGFIDAASVDSTGTENARRRNLGGEL